MNKTDSVAVLREQNATMIEMLEASISGMEEMHLRLPRDFRYHKDLGGWIRVNRSAVELLKKQAEGWYGAEPGDVGDAVTEEMRAPASEAFKRTMRALHRHDFDNGDFAIIWNAALAARTGRGESDGR